MNMINVVAFGAPGSPARQVQISPGLAIDALGAARAALTEQSPEAENLRGIALQLIDSVLKCDFMIDGPGVERGISPGRWTLGLLGSVVSDSRDSRIGGEDESRAYYGGEVICESAIDANRRAIMQLPEVVKFLRNVVKSLAKNGDPNGAPLRLPEIRGDALSLLHNMGCRDDL